MSSDLLKYNVIARSFHWVIAFLILGLLIVGFVMADLPYGPQKITVYNLHKSIGMTVLLFGILRIVWKHATQSPDALSTHKKWEKILSKTIHIVLYGVIILMPLSGWVMSSAGDFPVTFFGLFDVPKIVPKNEFIFDTFREVHEMLVFVIIGCVGLHVIGALKHYFIDRDTTLARMGGYPVLGFLGLILLAVALSFPAREFISELGVHEVQVADEDDAVHESALSQEVAVPIEAQGEVDPYGWVIDPQGSKIDFTFMQYGSAVSGSFESVKMDVVFNPDDMVSNKAHVEIDVKSIATGSADRDTQAKSDVWFDVDHFDTIVFQSGAFKVLDPAQGTYEVVGDLTIRDKTLPVIFPFTLDIKDDGQTENVVMKGDLTLQRLDFGVGQGQWESTEAIENAVKISLEVKAHRAL